MLLTENYLAFDPSQSNDNLYKVSTDSFGFWNSNGSRQYTGNLMQTYLDLYDEGWFDGNKFYRLQEYAKTGKRIPIVIKTITKIEVDPNLDPQPSAEEIAKWESENDTAFSIFYLDFYSSDANGISCSNPTTETGFFSPSDTNVTNLFTSEGFNFPFEPVSNPSNPVIE